MLIKKLDEKVLMITVHIGQGTAPDGTKFEMMTTTNGAMIIKFEKGNEYIINWKDFVKECDKIRLKK